MRKKLGKELDKLWSIAVRKIAGNRCEKCGKTKYLNAHHFYSRSAMSVRWSIDNGFSLCSGCHALSSTFSAHKTPAEFVEWAKNRRGDRWYIDVRQQFNTPHKYTISELKERKEELRCLIEN